MSESNLLIENQGSVRIITINRPKQLNALNSKTIDELSHSLKDAESEDSIKSIILTGSGDKAFVAGADIKEFASFSIEEGKKLSKEGHDKLFDLLQNLSTPVIAAINGFALGGGLELAMSAHIRVASDNAKMGLPEVSLGVIPGYGGTQRLAQLVGRGKAMEMIATAGMISAEDAHKWGLVNHVTSAEELMEKCHKIAIKVSRNSSTAISSAIKAVNANYQDGVNGYQVEVDEFGACFGTDDFKEGTTAFIERRKPNFK